MKSDFQEGSKCDLPRKRKQRGTTQGLERDDQMERAREDRVNRKSRGTTKTKSYLRGCTET